MLIHLDGILVNTFEKGSRNGAISNLTLLPCVSNSVNWICSNKFSQNWDKLILENILFFLYIQQLI